MTREQSQQYWPGGYYDPGGIAVRGNTLEQIASALILPHALGGFTLEIGPGGGTWTGLLARLSREVLAVDVVPKSASFTGRVTQNNVQYRVVEPFGSLDFVPDSSVNFIWSYDVFCHLPFRLSSAYFMEFGRVLKTGGHVGVMFPCRERHPDMKKVPELPRNEMNGWHWFNYSAEDIAELAGAGGLNLAIVDAFPSNRDRLALFRKP